MATTTIIIETTNDNTDVTETTISFEEIEHTTQLVKDGCVNYYAPIEIEHSGQLETLNITWNDCRTWHIGSERVTVYLCPADEATYRFLLGELRRKHRNGYRAVRCMVEGKLKPLIRCPESNKCSACPYGRKPEDREANIISWDGLIESGYEGEADNRMVEQLQAKLEYDEIRTLMDSENPIIAQVFEMKERDGFSVSEIADRLHIKPRNVYYYLDRAKAIGKKYNKEC